MYEMEHKIQAVKHGCRFALNSTKPEHHPVLKKVITTCSNLFLARESIISRIITYLVIGLLNYPQLKTPSRITRMLVRALHLVSSPNSVFRHQIQRTKNDVLGFAGLKCFVRAFKVFFFSQESCCRCMFSPSSDESSVCLLGMPASTRASNGRTHWSGIPVMYTLLLAVWWLGMNIALGSLVYLHLKEPGHIANLVH